VAVEEAEGGAQASVINELGHGVQFVQTVFQWRAGKHEGKGGAQALHNTRRLGLPVLDPLPFIQDDQVPFDGFNG
jgi:hypothetical protein